jgi:hypothetical protein
MLFGRKLDRQPRVAVLETSDFALRASTDPLVRGRSPRRMRRSTALLLFVIAGAASLAGLSACSEPEPVGPAKRADKGAAAPRADASAPSSAAAGIGDAGALATGANLDAGTYDGPTIAGLFLASPIMSEMEWPIRPDQLRPGERQRSIRVGYVRQGQRVPVIAEAHRKSNCTDGWYELVQGGFVCGKYFTFDMNHPKVKTAPRPPDLSGPLPYLYGYNLTNGTPLYKHIPSREERARFEPWLNVRSRPRARPREEDDDNPYATPSASPTFQTSLTNGAGIAISATSPSDPLGVGMDADAGVPWYLRDYDGGKPTVTLDELREDANGPIETRMVKGFYLSLDKDDTHFGAKWWRTQGSYYTPYDRIYVSKPMTEFHGVWLNQDPPPDAPPPEVTAAAGLPPLPPRIDSLPVGFILNSRAKRYTLAADRKAMSGSTDRLGRYTVVALTGEYLVVDRMGYYATREGWWMREIDGTRTMPGPPPADLAPGEKWIDVNAKTETLVAFEGDKPVYATLVSTGKRNLKDAEKDHPTKNGVFRIREKHIAATMDGDVASDGPYSIQDVPWIMYFNASIALHGAFWHSNFGHVQSHGCVNLAPWDAKALFGWTEPRLPAGWHGVAATEEHPGTRVIVHDEEKPVKREPLPDPLP